jgi:hypothetical protein
VGVTFFSMLFNDDDRVELYSLDDRMINECGADGGMRTGRGNHCSTRKLVPVPGCPSEITRALAWDRT